MKWKTVALPRLLGYVHKRLFDFSILAQFKGKREAFYPCEKKKKKCSLLQGMPFSPFKCSQQVLLAPPCRVPLSTTFCVVTVLESLGLPKEQPCLGAFWKASPVSNHLLEQMPGFHCWKSCQRHSSPEWTVSVCKASAVSTAPKCPRKY